MNNVILIGRLVRDPEVRYTQENSMAMGTFTIAVDRNMSRDRRQEAEARGQATADFIRIVTWGKTAELCGNYLAKGRLVAVSGRIQTGSYTNNQGQRVYTTDVVADRVQFLESARTNNNGAPQYNNQGAGYQQQNSYSNGPVNSAGASDFSDSNDDFVPFDDEDGRIPF